MGPCAYLLRFVRRALPLVILLAGTAAGLPGGSTPPNVLILLADDLGTDHVGAYTPGAGPTPNIDALAAGGLRFTQAWANPLCSPTRAALHTGRYGFRTGVQVPITSASTQGLLPLSETTLPELFDGPAPSGYRTGLFGKWHLDNELAPGGAWGPIAHGWDTFAGTLAGSVPSYCDWPRATASVSAPTPRVRRTTDYATTRVVDDALAWITGGAPGSPWLCLVAFQAPHSPLHAPPAALHTRALPAWPECEPLGPPMQPYYTPFYEAMVEALDTEIGRLLATLRAAGQLANTDVFFLGDNGTPTCTVAAPYAPYQGKGTVYEGGVRVPLIVSGPSVVRPGRDVTDMVHLVDLFPTIAELCGVRDNLPAGVVLDGRSLVAHLSRGAPSLSGGGLRALPPRPLRRFLLTDVGPVTDPCANGRPGVFHRGAVAIRDLYGYKLLRWRDWDTPGRIREELFDLWADPYESIPLPLQGPAYDRLGAALAGFACGGLCR